MGNTVLWKPASTAALSAHYTMKLFEEAGLPPGVVNLVYGRGSAVGDPALAQPRPRRHPLHRLDRRSSRTCGRRSARTSSSTGTTRASSARPAARTSSSPTPPPTSTRVATAIVRGSFEYQGQKCSAASRVYAPSNLWPELRERLAEQVAALKVGDVADFANFMGAVIDAGSFATQKEAIEEARAHGDSDVLVGGDYDDSEGFFVQPTVIETRDPNFRLLRDELFGPVVTAYVYPENEYEETLDLVDRTAPYGLTGAVFARDRSAIELAGDKLQYAAGQLLRQRQADRRGRRPAAVRRRARLGHERQGRLDVEPDPLGLAADDQGDVRAADRLPLSVPAPADGTARRTR